jgi:hypothetical protein
MKTDGMIDKFIKTKLEPKEEASVVFPVVEGRGCHDPGNKLDHDNIRQHINSYHPQISHYNNREHAPKRRYLQPGITVTDMWHDYCEKHRKISYELYRNVFKLERITIG